MPPKISLHIGPERTGIGGTTGVCGDGGHVADRLVPRRNLRAFGGEIFLKPAEFRQPADIVFVEKSDAVLIEIERALYPPPAGFFHGPPVSEGLGDQFANGDGGDGVVLVLHIDRVEGDFDDLAIGMLAGRLYPFRTLTIPANLFERANKPSNALEIKSLGSAFDGEPKPLGAGETC